jgi:hypothetical protein
MDSIRMSLTAEQILAADDCGSLEKITVPEWGGDVYVKVMDGASRDRFELATSKAMESPNTANVRASLAAATICDQAGKLLFSVSQVANLGKKSAVALDRIYAVSKRINRLQDDDIEELEKN